MGDLSVELAETPEEIDAVRHLSRAFRQWLYDHYPAERRQIELYYNPEKFEALLAELPRIHARPKGSMFLARLDGESVGCVMQHEIVARGTAYGNSRTRDLGSRPHGLDRGIHHAALTSCFV